MSKTAFGAVFSLLLLAGCGDREQGSTVNQGAEPGSSLGANSAEPGPQPHDPASEGPAEPPAGPVPPPDAVSHPNGYLPPAPAEPEPASGNSSGSGEPPPATEDEYLRNGQRQP